MALRNSQQDLISLKKRIEEALNEIANMGTAQPHKKFRVQESLQRAQQTIKRLEEGIMIVVEETKQSEKRVLNLAHRYAVLIARQAELDWEDFPEEEQAKLSDVEKRQMESAHEALFDEAQELLLRLEDAAIDIDEDV